MSLPLVVGISGASGAVFGIRLLQILRDLKIGTHLVLSRSALQTINEELDLQSAEIRDLADNVHSNQDIGAPIASGSYRTLGMIVAPCSIRTLSNIAYGATDTLMSRAADVVLKERRRLVLMVRETPLHAGHLRAMLAATESGAVIMPPVPTFYNRPTCIDDMVVHTIGRALDLFDIDAGVLRRWRGKT